MKKFCRWFSPISPRLTTKNLSAREKPDLTRREQVENMVENIFKGKTSPNEITHPLGYKCQTKAEAIQAIIHQHRQTLVSNSCFSANVPSAEMKKCVNLYLVAKKIVIDPKGFTSLIAKYLNSSYDEFKKEISEKEFNLALKEVCQPLDSDGVKSALVRVFNSNLDFKSVVKAADSNSAANPEIKFVDSKSKPEAIKNLISQNQKLLKNSASGLSEDMLYAVTLYAAAKHDIEAIQVTKTQMGNALADFEFIQASFHSSMATLNKWERVRSKFRLKQDFNLAAQLELAAEKNIAAPKSLNYANNMLVLELTKLLAEASQGKDDKNVSPFLKLLQDKSPREDILAKFEEIITKEEDAENINRYKKCIVISLKVKGMLKGILNQDNTVNKDSIAILSSQLEYQNSLFDELINLRTSQTKADNSLAIAVIEALPTEKQQLYQDHYHYHILLRKLTEVAKGKALLDKLKRLNAIQQTPENRLKGINCGNVIKSLLQDPDLGGSTLDTLLEFILKFDKDKDNDKEAWEATITVLTSNQFIDYTFNRLDSMITNEDPIEWINRLFKLILPRTAKAKLVEYSAQYKQVFECYVREVVAPAIQLLPPKACWGIITDFQIKKTFLERYSGSLFDLNNEPDMADYTDQVNGKYTLNEKKWLDKFKTELKGINSTSKLTFSYLDKKLLINEINFGFSTRDIGPWQEMRGVNLENAISAYLTKYPDKSLYDMFTTSQVIKLSESQPYKEMLVDTNSLVIDDLRLFEGRALDLDLKAVFDPLINSIIEGEVTQRLVSVAEFLKTKFKEYSLDFTTGQQVIKSLLDLEFKQYSSGSISAFMDDAEKFIEQSKLIQGSSAQRCAEWEINFDQAGSYAETGIIAGKNNSMAQQLYGDKFQNSSKLDCGYIGGSTSSAVVDVEIEKKAIDLTKLVKGGGLTPRQKQLFHLARSKAGQILMVFGLLNLPLVEAEGHSWNDKLIDLGDKLKNSKEFIQLSLARAVEKFNQSNADKQLTSDEISGVGKVFEQYGSLI